MWKYHRLKLCVTALLDQLNVPTTVSSVVQSISQRVELAIANDDLYTVNT